MQIFYFLSINVANYISISISSSCRFVSCVTLGGVLFIGLRNELSCRCCYFCKTRRRISTIPPFDLFNSIGGHLSQLCLSVFLSMTLKSMICKYVVLRKRETLLCVETGVTWREETEKSRTKLSPMPRTGSFRM